MYWKCTTRWKHTSLVTGRVGIFLNKVLQALTRDVSTSILFASLIGCWGQSLPTTYLGVPWGCNPGSQSFWDLVVEQVSKRLNLKVLTCPLGLGYLDLMHVQSHEKSDYMSLVSEEFLDVLGSFTLLKFLINISCSWWPVFLYWKFIEVLVISKRSRFLTMHRAFIGSVIVRKN